MKPELDLSKELGINRATLKNWRNDGKVTGWERVGNKILYSIDGEKEARLLVMDKLSVTDIGERKPDPSEPTEFTITKIPLNTKMVLCGDVKVRVSTNKNFMRGMKVKARPPGDGGSVWVMVGRCPRWKGKY